MISRPYQSGQDDLVMLVCIFSTALCKSLLLIRCSWLTSRAANISVELGKSCASRKPVDKQMTANGQGRVPEQLVSKNLRPTAKDSWNNFCISSASFLKCWRASISTDVLCV